MAGTTFPGWKRWYVLRDLAAVVDKLEGTEQSQLELLQPIAEKRRCSAKRVYDFLQENQYEVEQVRANADDEYAGQWVANKAIRVAAHEQFILDIEAALEAGWKDDSQTYTKLRRLQMLSLRYVEESLGQLPQRVQIDSNVNLSGRVEVEHANEDLKKFLETQRAMAEQTQNVLGSGGDNR